MADLKLIHTADDPVRLSFPDVFEAVQYEGKGPFRYNASLLIVPGGANDKRVQAAILEAANEKFGKKAAAILESIRGNSNKMCYVKGDLKEYEGYQGKLVLSAHRKQEAGRPLLIDGNKNPLNATDGKPYAGCNVNGAFDLYVSEDGIHAGLVSVQFVGDNESFGGGGPATADDFEEIAEGADADDLTA